MIPTPHKAQPDGVTEARETLMRAALQAAKARILMLEAGYLQDYHEAMKIIDVALATKPL